MTNDERQEELFAAIEQNPGKPEAYWPLIVEFVAQYMQGLGKTHITKDDAQRIAGCWKQEMS